MSKKWSPYFLIGGGTVIAGAAWLASRKSSSHVESIVQALQGTDEPDTDTGEKGVFEARLTGYWPFTARADERKMEGGVKDRKGNPLYTLEMHQKDPSRYPYVSVAGDYEIWPYGQRIQLDAWPELVFRVVDTGGHFYGAGKLYRIAGAEPLDICVDSSESKVPHKPVRGRIVVGDNFEHGKAVASKGFKGQTVVTGDIKPWIGLCCIAYDAAVESGDLKKAAKFKSIIERYS